MHVPEVSASSRRRSAGKRFDHWISLVGGTEVFFPQGIMKSAIFVFNKHLAISSTSNFAPNS
jgi:hypothetical protein